MPKKLLDALRYPHVKLEKGKPDITLFRVEATGEKEGYPRLYKVEMVNRYDEVLGFTSLARTTAFAGSIVARMIARGDIKATDLLTAEQIVVGPLFDILLDESAAAKI